MTGQEQNSQELHPHSGLKRLQGLSAPAADMRNRVSVPVRDSPSDPAPILAVRCSPTGRYLLVVFRCAAAALCHAVLCGAGLLLAIFRCAICAALAAHGPAGAGSSALGCGWHTRRLAERKAHGVEGKPEADVCRGMPSEIWSVGGGDKPTRVRQIDLQFTAGEAGLVWACDVFSSLKGLSF